MTHLRQIATSVVCLFLLLLTDQIQAQTLVSLTSVSGHPGDEVEVTVQLTEAENITALQLQIPLSETLAYVDGSATLTTELATTSHQISVSQSNRLLKIYVFSMALETFKASVGSLLTFRLLLGREPGTYELNPDMILTNSSGETLDFSIHAGQLTVLSPKIQLSTNAIHFGRVPIQSTYTEQVVVTNIGNEPLTVTDAISSLPILSVSPTYFTLLPGNQQPLIITYAPDQYGNDCGSVLVNSNAVNGQQRITFDAEPYSVNILSLSNVSGNCDDEVTIHVSLQNMEPIVAVQCRLALPEGVTYVEGSAQLITSRTNGHQITAHESNNQISFYIYSDNNVAFQGTEGNIFSFRLKLSTTGGTYPLTLSDVLLSNIDGLDMTSSTEDAILRVAAPRIECAPILDFGSVPMEELATRTFTIHNTGEQPLTLSRIEFSNAAFRLSESTSLPTIEAGTTGDITIVYEPDGEQQIEATMQLYCNDPDNRMQVIIVKASSYPTNRFELSGDVANSQTGSFAVNIELQNSSPIVALQFDLHWIDGMTTTQDLITLSPRADGHQVALSKVDDSTYRIYVYSNTNAIISPDNGPLLSIIYNKVSTEVNYELSTILIDNIILSTLEGQNKASSFTASFLVMGLLGDANGDGHVSVTDVACIVDYLMERQPSPFIRELADVNEDGDVTISDIVEVINLIMQNK